jgi:hypothetical protein
VEDGLGLAGHRLDEPPSKLAVQLLVAVQRRHDRADQRRHALGEATVLAGAGQQVGAQ